jgi:hypothetical protein
MVTLKSSSRKGLKRNKFFDRQSRAKNLLERKARSPPEAGMRPKEKSSGVIPDIPAGRE